MYVSEYSDKSSHIQTYLGTIRYIQELLRHIHAYSELYVTQRFVEPWYIQNPGIFKH